jgi:hypothetical protein
LIEGIRPALSPIGARNLLYLDFQTYFDYIVIMVDPLLARDIADVSHHGVWGQLSTFIVRVL